MTAHRFERVDATAPVTVTSIGGWSLRDCESWLLELLRDEATMVLRLSTDLGRGFLLIDEGEPVAARIGTICGDRAFLRIHAATRGSFSCRRHPLGHGRAELWNDIAADLDDRIHTELKLLLRDARAHRRTLQRRLRELPSADLRMAVARPLAAHERGLARRHSAAIIENLAQAPKSLAELRAMARWDDVHVLDCVRDLLEVGVLSPTQTFSRPPPVPDGRTPAISRVEVVAATPPPRRNWLVGVGLAVIGISGATTLALGSSPATPVTQRSTYVQAHAAARINSSERPRMPVVRPCSSDMVWVVSDTSWDGRSTPPSRGFCMDTHEVTVAQYRKCSDIGECQRAHRRSTWPRASTPVAQWHKQRDILSQLCNENRVDGLDHPVNCVTWFQARGYCEWQGKRLPTTDEWTKAATGNAGRLYPWGNTKPSARHVNGCGYECWSRRGDSGLSQPSMAYPESDGFRGTAPVGSFPGGNTPSGISDLSGNVHEWTADGDEHKAIRGGGFNSTRSEYMTAVTIYGLPGTAHTHAVGFRCAADSAALGTIESGRAEANSTNTHAEMSASGSMGLGAAGRGTGGTLSGK